jgi:uncharacterized protein
MMRKLLVCFFVGVLAVSATVAAAQASKAEQSATKHFLWVVKPASGPPTYLLGSLHVLSAEYYPLSPKIDQAFAQAKVLIEEINLDEMSNPAAVLPFLSKAMFTDGRTLDKAIAPDLFKKVVERSEKAGIPMAALQRMKPWMAAASLTLPSLKAAGFNTELGIDKHFFDRAKAIGLERRGLESIAYQFDRLDQMSPAVQEAMLASVIADIETQLSSVKTIAAAWAQGDTATIERLLLGAMRDTPELYERLLVERNRNWVAPVEACLTNKEACFVVVGAAHLVGDHSLVALLRQKGYTVEQQ